MTPGLQCMGLSPTAAKLLWLPWVVTSSARLVYDLCHGLYYDGNTQRITKIGFMEKTGIKPATPGLFPTLWRLWQKKIFLKKKEKHLFKSSWFQFSFFSITFVQDNVHLKTNVEWHISKRIENLPKEIELT